MRPRGQGQGPWGLGRWPRGREGLERLWQSSKARGENSLPWALRSQLRTYPGSLFLTYCWDGSRSLDVTVTYKKEVNNQELPWQCEIRSLREESVGVDLFYEAGEHTF